MVKDCILDISNSLDFINRYCSNLSKFDDKHTQLCYYMCSKIEDEDIVSENTPVHVRQVVSVWFLIYLG